MGRRRNKAACPPLRLPAVRPNPLIVELPFHVGPFTYRAVKSDRLVFDEAGNELEACAIEARRLVIISCIVHPTRHEEIVRHEIRHAWEFHFPRPHDAEEECQFFAAISTQFDIDLETAGGREALMELVPRRVPHRSRTCDQFNRDEIGEQLIKALQRAERAEARITELEAAIAAGEIEQLTRTVSEASREPRVDPTMKGAFNDQEIGDQLVKALQRAERAEALIEADVKQQLRLIAATQEQRNEHTIQPKNRRTRHRVDR
jgi:hypothetical protein